MQVELLYDAAATLGEGPVWHREKLYWVDIEQGELHALDPVAEEDAVFKVGFLLGAAVPSQSGDFLLAGQDGLLRFDLESGELTPIADPEADRPNNRFNDAKCDPAGRLWGGTMSMAKEKQAGSLYCLDADSKIEQKVRRVTTSNGLAWSPDKRTFYYIDTPTRRVDAFDYDIDTGAISNRRSVVEFPDGVGRPDGMTIDTDGMLWVAHWAGWRISRWNPIASELLAEYPLPVEKVTSCTFGGSNLDELYITTARHQLTEVELAEQPTAGGLFVLRAGVTGFPTDLFAG
jgi:sugar lactone lactonase YvrE